MKTMRYILDKTSHLQIMIFYFAIHDLSFHTCIPVIKKAKKLNDDWEIFFKGDIYKKRIVSRMKKYKEAKTKQEKEYYNDI